MLIVGLRAGIEDVKAMCEKEKPDVLVRQCLCATLLLFEIFPLERASLRVSNFKFSFHSSLTQACGANANRKAVLCVDVDT